MLKVKTCNSSEYTMSLSQLYAKSSGATNDAVNYLSKYAHLLQWKNYKENILEVGCGPGYITRKVLYPLIENYVVKLKAVDLAENMIEFARKNNDEDKIEFKIMDMSKDIVEMEAKFDHIITFNCAHYMVDQRSFIERLYKMLKPGGQIFVTAVTKAALYETFRNHIKHEIWSKYLPKTSAYADFTEDPEKYMRDLLKQTGFEIDICNATTFTNRFSDFPDFARSLIYMHPFLNYIPKEKQEEYIQDHIRRYCDANIRLDNTNDFDVTYGSLIFVASKNI